MDSESKPIIIRGKGALALFICMGVACYASGGAANWIFGRLFLAKQRELEKARMDRGNQYREQLKALMDELYDLRVARYANKLGDDDAHAERKRNNES